MGQLGWAVPADGKADRTEAAIHVELHLVEAVEALDVLFAHGRKGKRAKEREPDLAAVGVTGEDEVNERPARVADYFVGEVGAVAHQQDRAVGVARDGEVEDGVASRGVVHAADPEALAAAFDRDVAVDEDGNAAGLKQGGNQAAADGVIVVAEAGEAQGAVQVLEDLSAVLDRVDGDGKRERPARGEVAGEQDEVGRELVDAVEREAEEGGFGVLVEVDVADLDDAEAVEGIGKSGDTDGAGDHIEVVAGDQGCVDHQPSGDCLDPLEEVAPGQP